MVQQAIGYQRRLFAGRTALHYTVPQGNNKFNKFTLPEPSYQFINSSDGITEMLIFLKYNVAFYVFYGENTSGGANVINCACVGCFKRAGVI